MRSLVSGLLIFFQFVAFGQDSILEQLKERSEAVVSFPVSELNKLPDLGRFSVDKISQTQVTLYVNQTQFQYLTELGIPLTLVEFPSVKSVITMANSMAGMKDWDAYPTYSTYVSMMQFYANQYPDQCQLDTIGTSVNGHLILALRITNPSDTNQNKPQVFFTSSMHGDELTGFVLMLHLVDFLLTNPGYPKVMSLLNGLEIYINPLSNPDGAYFSGDNTVSGSTRYNANAVDLNRNYPDPVMGEHPDGNSWQPENLAMMNYMKKHHFILSANFHGGSEVMNYPWDSKSALHPDDSWFQLICRQYADSVHLVDPNYMTDLQNGITNGWAWYYVFGGRQDYVTHFLHGREVTAEISSVKLPDSSELPSFWSKSYPSLLNYLSQALYGLKGVVTDEGGNPLAAKITVLNHDKDSSFVRTETYGVYYRMLKGGSYNLLFEANGYENQEIDNVIVSDFSVKMLSVVLKKTNSVLGQKNPLLKIYPNPLSAGQSLNFEGVQAIQVDICNLQGQIVRSYRNPVSPISLNKLLPGIYLIHLVDHEKNFITAQLIVE